MAGFFLLPINTPTDTPEPSIQSQNLFTGATIPMTYYGNTHEWENNYVYKSDTHDIYINGIQDKGLVVNDGTKEVTIMFDTFSHTTSITPFTITLVKETEEIVYNGLFAYYGESVDGIIAFAFNNVPIENEEIVLGQHYQFIVTTSSTDLPYFTSTTQWNGIYSYQLLSVCIGNFTGTTINANFLSGCYSFNQPLHLPTVRNIGAYFLSSCASFNQPITIPQLNNSYVNNVMAGCYSFNQPMFKVKGQLGGSFMAYCYNFNNTLDISEVTYISNDFMYYCHTFNQPLDFSNVTVVSGRFMYECNKFNQPMDFSSCGSSTFAGSGFLQNGLSFNSDIILSPQINHIGDYFLEGGKSFNRPLNLENITNLGSCFLRYCVSFNQPLNLPNLLKADLAFLSGCNSFNNILSIPKVTTIRDNFLSGCYSFNQPIDLTKVTTIQGNALRGCYSFNQPLHLSNLSTLSGQYNLANCFSFNRVLTIPESLISITAYALFLNQNYSLSTIIWNAKVYPTDNNSLAQTTNSKTSATGKGIIVHGNIGALKTALPDRASSPYRKLIPGKCYLYTNVQEGLTLTITDSDNSEYTNNDMIPYQTILTISATEGTTIKLNGEVYTDSTFTIENNTTIEVTQE